MIFIGDFIYQKGSSKEVQTMLVSFVGALHGFLLCVVIRDTAMHVGPSTGRYIAGGHEVDYPLKNIFFYFERYLKKIFFYFERYFLSPLSTCYLI